MADDRRVRVRGRITDTSAYAILREVVLTGVAVIVPVAISLYVLLVVFDLIRQLLGPVASFLPGRTGLVSQLLAVGVLVGLILAVGFVAHFRAGKRAIDYFDAAMGRIPGIGTVYQSFRRMSDIMLDGDAQHFREVKLVAFPARDTYAIGFETADTPATIETAVGKADEGMSTLFVPLAPNPVMGGFVVHVPASRVFDVDMTVEEGIRATVTSGVALGADGGDSFTGPTWQLPEVGVRSLEVDDLRERGVEEIGSLHVDELEERLFGSIGEDRDDTEDGS